MSNNFNSNYFNKTSVNSLFSGLTSIYETITTATNLINPISSSITSLSNTLTNNYYTITGVNNLISINTSSISGLSSNLNNYYTITGVNSLISGLTTIYESITWHNILVTSVNNNILAI